MLDATDAWSLTIAKDETAGIPDDVLETAHALAKAEGQTGYKLTLKMPCYLPVMQYAHSSTVREKMYRAYATRASDLSEHAQFDNSALLI